jgi:hypothetical protein
VRYDKLVGSRRGRAALKGGEDLGASNRRDNADYQDYHYSLDHREAPPVHLKHDNIPQGKEPLLCW